MHSWDVSAEEARALQRDLAPMVSCVSAVSADVRRVAGTDVSSPDPGGVVRAAVVVLAYPTLQVEEVSLAEGRPTLPYIPGLLSFRETPVLMGALGRLEQAPDLIIVDGQGCAHPRSFGLACHVGLITDVPTIGCAKSRLTGKHGPLSAAAGSRAELMDKGKVVGMALRTRSSVRPVYVSVGHKVDLASAVEWVLACCRGTRLPETTRLAHRAAAGRAVSTTSNSKGGTHAGP
jgi:deoxyribonuclease V